MPFAPIPAPIRTPALSPNAIVSPARRIIPHLQSKRAAALPSSPPASSSRPAGCGIRTNYSRHSGRLRRRRPQRRRLLVMPLTRPPCQTTCSRRFAKAASVRKTIRAARRYSSPSSVSSSGGTGASKPLSSYLRSTRTESLPSTRSACARKLSALMAKPQAGHQSAAEALPLPPADLRQHSEQRQLRSRARRRTLRISCRPSAL